MAGGVGGEGGGGVRDQIRKGWGGGSEKNSKN